MVLNKNVHQELLRINLVCPGKLPDVFLVSEFEVLKNYSTIVEKGIHK